MANELFLTVEAGIIVRKSTVVQAWELYYTTWKVLSCR